MDSVQQGIQFAANTYPTLKQDYEGAKNTYNILMHNQNVAQNAATTPAHLQVMLIWVWW